MQILNADRKKVPMASVRHPNIILVKYR